MIIPSLIFATLGATMTLNPQPQRTEQTAVRVLLFNKKGELLLQQVNIPGRPSFFITPGGRLDSPQENLLDAVRRELLEETGFDQVVIQPITPIFSGSHVMQRGQDSVKMTEHFFAVHLELENDSIVESRQNLTAEERQVLTNQIWVSIAELRERNFIFVPINLAAVATAVLNGQPVPAVDFRDPPGLARG